MPGKPPRFRLFISDEEGKMPSEIVDGHERWVEFAALWETRLPDKHGRPKYSGQTGKGKQFAMIVEALAPKNEQRFDENAPPDDKTPF